MPTSTGVVLRMRPPTRRSYTVPSVKTVAARKRVTLSSELFYLIHYHPDGGTLKLKMRVKPDYICSGVKINKFSLHDGGFQHKYLARLGGLAFMSHTDPWEFLYSVSLFIQKKRGTAWTNRAGEHRCRICEHTSPLSNVKHDEIQIISLQCLQLLLYVKQIESGGGAYLTGAHRGI